MRWGPVSKKQAKNSQKSAHLWQKKSCRLCYTSISLWKKCSLQPRRPPRELPGINEFKAVAAGETASLSSPVSILRSFLTTRYSLEIWHRRGEQTKTETSQPFTSFRPPHAAADDQVPLTASLARQSTERAGSRTVRLAHPQLRPQRQHNFLEGRISGGITSTRGGGIHTSAAARQLMPSRALKPQDDGGTANRGGGDASREGGRRGRQSALRRRRPVGKFIARKFIMCVAAEGEGQRCQLSPACGVHCADTSNDDDDHNNDI